MKHLTQRKFLYTFLCLVVVIILYYVLFLDPILYQIDLLSRELSTLEEDMLLVENKSRELNAVRYNIEKTEALLLDCIASFPDDYDSHDMICLLLDAQAGSLDRHSLIFLEPVFRTDYKVLPVRFSFSSDYNGLIRFLSGLDALQARVSISNMQITAAAMINDNENLSLADKEKLVYNLDVDMTINFYVKEKEQ